MTINHDYTQILNTMPFRAGRANTKVAKWYFDNKQAKRLSKKAETANGNPKIINEIMGELKNDQTT